MSGNTVTRWHQLVKEQNADNISSILADDVVFYSPILHAAQEGKDLTLFYLTAAFHVFFNDTFHYVREVVGENDAVLEFMVEIDGIIVNGVDMMKWNDAGQIIEFKVMLRPLKGIQLIQQKMMAMLESMK